LKSSLGLLAARLFLAVKEAGLFPGVWFNQSGHILTSDVQYRAALFVFAATIADAFGNILAYAFEKMGGTEGLAWWSWSIHSNR